MQQSLSNARPFFDEATKLTDKLFLAFDVDSNKFLYLNTAVEEVCGTSIEDLSNNPASLIDTVHSEDREFLIQTYKEIVKGKKKTEVEFRLIPSGENQRWITFHPFLIEKEPNRRVIVGFAEDITKRKDKEDNLQKFAAKKDSIMEILANDLAGPLNNIKGIASLLADELKGADHPNLDKLVGMIEKTSERSIRLIREFVKMEFIQSENASFIKRRVDIVEKMEEVLEQYKGSASDISKTFHFKPSDEPIYIKIDVYKFTQVINNLISNAIKFTKDNGEITLRLEEKKDSVLISVADNGIGIPEKFHDKLFDKFTKARREGLKGEPSVGLGMSIIKTIVEWHRGKIWFKSKEGEGSTFYVELPKE